MDDAVPTSVIFGEALVDDFVTEQVVGGAPFNVARHLAALMSPQLMITRIGSDKNGAVVRAEFERFAMRATGLQVDPMEETGRVIIERSPRGHRFVILPRQAYDFIDAALASAALAQVTPAVLYFGTLAQRNDVARATLFTLLAECAATRFLDLNLRDGQFSERCVSDSLHAADIVKLNEDELQVLLKWYVKGAAPAAPGGIAPTVNQLRVDCEALLRMFSLQALIVTLGHRGSAYFGADGTVLVNRDNPAPPYVIDTVGAGDAFSAVFLLGRARGWTLAQTLARANEFAGAVCAIPGAVPRDLGFYDQWMARWRALP